MSDAKRSSLVFFILLSLGLSFSAVAQSGEELSFTATADRVTLDLDEDLTLTVEVSGTGIGAVGEPKLPALEDFEVLGRSSSQSSQFSIVNGKMTATKSISYIYTLRPRKTGELTIGSAEVTYKRKVYRTEPIKVIVTKGSAPKGQIPVEPPATLDRRDIFLDARVDRKEPFVGEQITIEYSLFVAVGLTNVRLGDVPSYPGFWSEEMFSAKRLDFTTKVVGGRRYEVAPIKTVAIFPTAPGRFEIEPMSIVCDVPERSADMFRDFWGRSKTVTVRSEPIQIGVKPLPSSGRPRDFSGAVGSFDFSMKVPSRSANVGEPLEVDLALSGQGNVRTVEVPKLPELPGFKAYEPEVEVRVSNSGNRVSGSKTYKYMLVPGSEGKYVIPGLRFSFFDPVEQKYRVLSTDEVVLEIRPGTISNALAGSGRAPVQVLGRDILYIKPDLKRMRSGAGRLHANPLFLSLQVIPALFLLAAYMYDRRRQRMEADSAYVRSRNAGRAAFSRLKGARSSHSRGDFQDVPGEVSRALASYVSDKMNLPAPGLTLDAVARELGERGFSEEAVSLLGKCIEECDYLRFGASKVDRATSQAIIELARQVVDRLEKDKPGRVNHR